MEEDVVFPHELVDLDFVVHPPLPPFLRVVSDDGNVRDGRVEPDVEDLSLYSSNSSHSTGLSPKPQLSILLTSDRSWGGQCRCAFKTLVRVS